MKHFDTLQTAFRSFFPLYLKKYACISEKNVFNISLFFFFPRITKNIHRSLQRRTFVNETYVILLVPYTDNIWRVYAWSESGVHVESSECASIFRCIVAKSDWTNFASIELFEIRFVQSLCIGASMCNIGYSA